MTMRQSPFAALLAALVMLAPWGVSGAARGEMAEETLQTPTDGIVTHLFPLNPAVLTSKGLRLGLIGVRNSRSTTLDQQASGGAKITSKVSDDHGGAAANIDLGAGAGLELAHTVQFHKVETTVAGGRRGDTIGEIAQYQQTAMKLGVELTSELRAAITVRYLQTDATILGATTLSPGMSTHYAASLFGFGSGFTYTTPTAGIGYSYFPPLHGKTMIYGQEEMLAEAGFIAVDAYWQPTGTNLTLGLLAKRWLNELDDLAAGTTAADNKTRISLYGLDPDQYVIHDQLLMLGAAYAVSKQFGIRFAVGQENDHIDMRNYLLYSQIQVRPQGLKGLSMTRERAALHFSNAGVDIDVGVGLWGRKYAFSADEGGASYATSAQEVFATLTLRP